MEKKRLIQKVFLILVIIFVLLVGFIFIPFNDDLKSSLFPLAGIFALVFLILGVYLLIIIRKVKLDKWLKRWLMLVGISPIGVVLSIILHNLIYGLFMVLFGKDFWGDGDEGLFFILGLIVFPLLFLVGLIGSFVRWGKFR
jgi:hypothetical protein